MQASGRIRPLAALFPALAQGMAQAGAGRAVRPAAPLTLLAMRTSHALWNLYSLSGAGYEPGRKRPAIRPCCRRPFRREGGPVQPRREVPPTGSSRWRPYESALRPARRRPRRPGPPSPAPRGIRERVAPRPPPPLAARGRAAPANLAICFNAKRGDLPAWRPR